MGEGPAKTGAAPATDADASGKPGKDGHAKQDHADLKKNAMKAVKMAYRYSVEGREGRQGDGTQIESVKRIEGRTDLVYVTAVRVG